MNNSKIIKAGAFLCAILTAAAMLSGCKNKIDNTDNNTTNNTEITTSAAPSETEEQTIGTMRQLAEGDVYAINKFTVPEELPGDYRVYVKSQEDQGIVYLNDISQIVVRAANFKEDFADLATYADSGCASIKINNMLDHCDTDFETPVNTKIAGFDAIYYDYLVTANEFIKENEDDEEGVKSPVAWYKSRIYYFYSDNDVYYIMFETERDNWEKAVGDLEAFVELITINENAVNEAPAEN